MAREGEEIPVTWPGTSGPAAPPGEGGEHAGAVVGSVESLLQYPRARSVTWQ